MRKRAGRRELRQTDYELLAQGNFDRRNEGERKELCFGDKEDLEHRSNESQFRSKQKVLG